MRNFSTYLTASLLLALAFNAQASLTSYNASGVDLVFSSVSDVTWTKDGNLLQTLGNTQGYQIRGAFANYYNQLKADFKSIAASGWGAELIPDQDILQSQFPQVLAELESQHARLAELQALFAAAGEDDFEDSDDTGVLPPDEVKALKANLKEAKGMHKAAKRDSSLGDPDSYRREAERLEAQLARHKQLEDEAKQLKAEIKTTEKSRDQLVEQARLKIGSDEARQVIVERLKTQLFDSYRLYLRADQRACIAAIENLWNKYAVTAKQIEAERDQAAAELQTFLRELGYE